MILEIPEIAGLDSRKSILRIPPEVDVPLTPRVRKIIDTFVQHEVVDDFSVSVTYDQIAEKNYSFSAGQYFEVKIEYVDITAEEFEAKMNAYRASLAEKFQKGHELEQSIMEQLGGLKL